MKRQRARKLYASGKSISDIATALQLTRTTIYNYRSTDLAESIDWEELRYLKQTDSQSTANNEQKFLNTLIESFETTLTKLEEIDNPTKRLEALAKFANTYYKIKQPNQSDQKIARAKGASDAIYALSQVAIEQHKTEVVEWLSQNHDLIIQRVLSSQKS